VRYTGNWQGSFEGWLATPRGSWRACRGRCRAWAASGWWGS